jgi:hypothetical protein
VEQQARGLLTVEAQEALVRAWAFGALERGFVRYRKLFERDIRHTPPELGVDCPGLNPMLGFVSYAVEPAAGRGLSVEGYAALVAAERAVAAWREAFRAGATLRVEPLVHVARCSACGREVGREALRFVLKLPSGRILTREALALLPVAGGVA